MGKIDLGRERGVRITGSAQHGATSPRGYESAMQGVSRMNAAADNVARGMRHVSDTLFKVYNDQAETRNRQEFLEGQTMLFDITNQANEQLEQDIQAGKFDGADGLESFKKSVEILNGNINKKFGEWASKNITGNDTRSRLLEASKLDVKKNFAHLSGRFLAHDQQRRWQMCEKQMSDAIAFRNKKNGEIAIKAYCVGKSEEFKKNLLNEFEYKFARARASEITENIKVATTFDEVFSQMEELRTNGYDLFLTPHQRQAFDVFALAKIDAIESAEAKAEEKQREAEEKQREEQDKAIEEEVKSMSKLYEDNFKAQQKASENAVKGLYGGIKTSSAKNNYVDWESTERKLDSILSESNLSDDRKSQIRGDFDVFKQNTIAEIEANKDKALKQQAFNSLESAMQNEGKIDSKILNDTPEDVKARQKAKEIANNPHLASYDEQQLYLHKYHLFEKRILAYDENTDKDGKVLASLLSEAQNYADAERIKLVKTIDTIVNKRAPNPKWSNEDVKVFRETFMDKCEVGNDRLWWGNDEVVGLNSDLYNRIYERAKKLNLTLTEALSELDKDPYFQLIQSKKGRELALELIK